MDGETVFVSYSSKDVSFVERLVGDLRSRSIPVWYDRFDLNVGDSVPGAISGGISNAKYLMIILSPSALESAWVREELNAGLMKQINLGGTFVLPVLYEECDIPPLLAHRRYADFRSDYAAGLSALLSA